MLNPGNLENNLLKVPQKWLGNRNSSPSSSKVFGGREQFPKFLKSIRGKGPVTHVPQKHLGTRTSYPCSSKNWRIVTVPQVPQNINYLGNRKYPFPKKMGNMSAWGKSVLFYQKCKKFRISKGGYKGDTWSHNRYYICRHSCTCIK